MHRPQYVSCTNVFLACIVAIGSACGSGDTEDGTESGDSVECAPGTVEFEGACAKSCNADSECGGLICLEELCVSGVRPSIVLASPVDGAVIGANTEIVLQFSTSMDVPTVNLSGGLAQKSYFSVSSVAADSDTLTIVPKTSWSNGLLTLVIDATSVDGVPMLPQQFQYIIDGGAL